MSENLEPRTVKCEGKPPRGGESFYYEYNERNLFQSNCLGYCRVSTVKQKEEGHSLLHQCAAIVKHAQSKHLNIHRIYTDAGISGKLIKNRPAINEVLNELKPGDTFVITSLSRMARNIDDARNVYNTFMSKKVNFVILDLQIETSSPDGEFLFNLFAGLATQERRKISERTKNVLRNMIEKGEYKGKPAFGFVSLEKKQPCVPCDKEQEILADIKRLKEENPQISVNQLTDYLSERYAPPRKSKAWHAKYVRNILVANKIIEVHKVDNESEMKVVDFIKERINIDPNVSDADLTREIIAQFPVFGRAKEWTQTKVRNLILKHKLRKSKMDRLKEMAGVARTNPMLANSLLASLGVAQP